MLPNVIFEPQTSGGVYNPKSPKNSSMRYFNVSYHKNLLRLRAYSSPTSRLHVLQVERILGMPRQQVIRGGGRLESKVRDPAQGRVPRKLHTATYPLVTTGGGALPLPTPVPQPATLRRASTAAIAKAIFFMGSPPCHDRGSLACNSALTSAERTHLHEIDKASRQITAAPLGRWRRGHRSKRATATRGRPSAQSRRVVREWVILSHTVKCEAWSRSEARSYGAAGSPAG
jgi:hypothetical protein